MVRNGKQLLLIVGLSIILSISGCTSQFGNTPNSNVLKDSDVQFVYFGWLDETNISGHLQTINWTSICNKCINLGYQENCVGSPAKAVIHFSNSPSSVSCISFINGERDPEEGYMTFFDITDGDIIYYPLSIKNNKDNEVTLCCDTSPLDKTLSTNQVCKTEMLEARCK